MATAKKKSTGGKRTASSSRSSSSKRTTTGTRSKKPAPRPVRREVGAVVCLLLAIFAALGYFHIQAIFIDFFCSLVKGLIGYGYLLLPPMLLVASGILAFHRGRPVQLRVWCALLLPVLAGGFFHLLLAKGEYTWTMELPKLLWTQGEAMTSGGVVSGVMALGLTAVFSKIGAGIIFVLLGAVLVMVAFRISPTQVVDSLRDQLGQLENCYAEVNQQSSMSFGSGAQLNLTGSNLSGVDLYGAVLEQANLAGIKTDEHTKWFRLHCPATGPFVAFKKCFNDRIVQLLVPADAKRTSATRPSCRCNKAKVLKITNFAQTEEYDEAWSLVDEHFVYRRGQWVTVDNFNNDRWYDSTTGIHFWMTREEAMAY